MHDGDQAGGGPLSWGGRGPPGGGGEPRLVLSLVVTLASEASFHSETTDNQLMSSPATTPSGTLGQDVNLHLRPTPPPPAPAPAARVLETSCPQR